MSKTEVLNFDVLVSKRIHTPRVDNNPLYLRVDGGMDTSESSNSTKTDKWYRIAKVNYSSPDNIRRVFITHKGVYTHLYRPPIGKETSLKIEKALKPDLTDVLQSMMSGGNSEIKYKLKGSGLAGITKPWVCNNIEEIFFDWSVLMSEDIMYGGYGEEALNCIRNNKAISSKTLEELFYRFCMGNVKDIRARFPRLKAIGYVTNLEELYRSTSGNLGGTSIDDLKDGWYSNLKKVPEGQMAALICVKPNEILTGRSVKSNIYAYDRDVLEGYFNKLEEKIKSYYREQINKDKKSDEIEISNNTETTTKINNIIHNKGKSEFENMLDDIEKEYKDIEFVGKMIMLATMNSSVEQREEILKDLSEDGVSKYSKWLGGGSL